MNKREQKTIIIGFILALIIFLGFVLVLLKFLYPSVLSIENDKIKLNKKIERYTVLKSKGLSFNEFKKLNSIYRSKIINPETNSETYRNKDLYEYLNEKFYKSLYKNIDEKFYNNSIYNGSYDEFENLESLFTSYLNKIDKNLIQIKNSKEFNNKKGNLSIVLPKYSSYLELDSKNALTDLKFINSVELLLKKFNLRTNSPIGIKNIVPASSNIINSKDSIYYIPLKLNITGTKVGIIDFFKYIKNSGSVKFNENEFDFTSDNGDISQLSEITNIELKEYIDNSLQKRSLQDFSLKNFLLKTGQTGDIIGVNVTINFYISSISSEKIINEINAIIGTNNSKIKVDKYGNVEKNEKTGEAKKELIHYNYSNILNVVKKLKGNTNISKNKYYSNKVNNIFLYLNNKELKKDIDNIKKELNKTDDLNSLYLKALKYKDIFSKIDKDIYLIVKSLGINKDKVYLKNYVFK